MPIELSGAGLAAEFGFARLPVRGARFAQAGLELRICLAFLFW
jgi:hypothetical protein